MVRETTLTRTHHLPTYYAKNPVLTGGMVFSDGVFYDPQDKLFKMWYMTKGGTAYATSHNGLTWEKPELDVMKGTNPVQTSQRDSNTVWLDLEEKDPTKPAGTARRSDARHGHHPRQQSGGCSCQLVVTLSHHEFLRR